MAEVGDAEVGVDVSSIQLPMMQQQSCSTLIEATVVRLYIMGFLTAGTQILAAEAESVKGFSFICLRPPSSAMSVITKRFGLKVRTTLLMRAL
jgi:hypothetical protein